MKKIITLLLAVILITSLAACGEDKNTSSNNMSSEGVIPKIGDEVSSIVSRIESGISSMTSMMTESGYSISKDDALNIALKDAGITKDSVKDYKSELDRELGILVYDIEFKSGDTEYSYEIHAENGTIIDKETEKEY